MDKMKIKSAVLGMAATNCYFAINKETKEYAHITKDQVEADPNLITCRISSLFHSEEISRYLKYKRIFEHPEMSSAEVSVAYRVNPQVRNVLEIEDSPVWVYFPTREDTSLPFLIHGSFETAVSREKLMTDSHFNRDLLTSLGILLQNPCWIWQRES